ncbi:HAD family hydrolase [Streptomyces sp. AM 2-1-1]|uniref:HAD family hydrolase n=1 Tax=Streptomyces sp. AM 2-1-1 TaxID=3028709 RepID=UPI0023B9FA88|nr:HAD family hydrolase [Streptomyces sp. AM 2-1-1]WEH40967.1 HAD family hydrolase [Streptomyces sp. AM 2-1-1]
MTEAPPFLVTVDVGGTLGSADGPGLAMRLAEASPLPAGRAREVMRTSLHTHPALTDPVVADVCEALRIPVHAFPRDLPPAPFRLFPGTMRALRQMSAVATVATLSNVTCIDADTEGLRDLLSPWVTDFFPSCRIGYTKPDPHAFQAVIEHFGAQRDQAIHVGDDWACDIEGAVASGIRPVWISRGRQAPTKTWSLNMACWSPSTFRQPPNTSPTSQQGRPNEPLHRNHCLLPTVPPRHPRRRSVDPGPGGSRTT